MNTPSSIFSLLLDCLGSRNTKLCETLSVDVEIDTPITGKKSGVEAARESLSRLSEWFYTYDSRLEHKKLISNGQSTFAAGELEALMMIEGTAIRLPIAATLGLKEGQLSRLHIYHSQWPVSHQHVVRAPVFQKNELAEVSEDVATYHRALETGNTELAVGLFEKDAWVREPSGGISGEGGQHKLNEFFTGAFARGGVSLIYHSFLDSGKTCAAEYTCYRWANQDIPPQAGMEFWDRGETKFQSVRIYDDVEQPN